MEKKTIGKFISALRRASGMTQKELGERLYVSDKTVSRWERDECTPELALLPAIAEIFGITTDELLRGERNSPAAAPTQGQQARSDKQFRLLLRSRTVRFRNLSMVSIGIGLAALILAVVINISFFKGILAFGIGAVVILAALICQLCVASASLLEPEDADDPHEDEIRSANSGVITGTAGVLMAITAIFAFMVPMGVLGGSYYSLNLGSLTLLGCGCSAVVLLVCYVVYIMWIRPFLARRALILPAPRNAGQHRLMKWTLTRGGIVTLVLAAALLLVQILGPTVFAGQVDRFTDPEAFRTFMQQGSTAYWIEATVRERSPEAVAAPTCVFIDVGNDGRYEDVLFPPEFEQVEITDAAGNVLCTYLSYGPFVRDVSWHVDAVTGDMKITAYTRRGVEASEEIFHAVRLALAALMILNVAAWAVIYGVKNFRMIKG